MHGLGVVLHDQPLGIASAMHIHLHVAKYHSINHATELFGQEMLVDDLILKSIDYSNGKAKLPEGSGWGIKLDEHTMKKFAAGPTITLEI